MKLLEESVSLSTFNQSLYNVQSKCISSLTSEDFTRCVTGFKYIYSCCNTRSVLPREFPPPVCLHKNEISCKIRLQKNKFFKCWSVKSTELRGRKTETQVVLSEQWEQNKPWFKVHCITVSQGYHLIHVLFFWASSIKLGQIKRAMQLALRFKAAPIFV